MTEEKADSSVRDRAYVNPDRSEIRLLAGGALGTLAQYTLAPGKSSGAITHRTVEELWYVLEGSGEIWRGAPGERGDMCELRAGDSLRIPPNVTFQFRAVGGKPLQILIATMPPWPGEGEAVRVPIDVFG